MPRTLTQALVACAAGSQCWILWKTMLRNEAKRLSGVFRANSFDSGKKALMVRSSWVRFVNFPIRGRERRRFSRPMEETAQKCATFKGKFVKSKRFVGSGPRIFARFRSPMRLQPAPLPCNRYARKLNLDCIFPFLLLYPSERTFLYTQRSISI